MPLTGGTPGALCPSRLNGSSLENDAFSDKSERENAEESDNETQDHSGKTNGSGSAQSETLEGPVPRGTTYVEQVHEEFGEVRARPPREPGVVLHLTRLPESGRGGACRAPGARGADRGATTRRAWVGREGLADGAGKTTGAV